jgi:hypothetical protein
VLARGVRAFALIDDGGYAASQVLHLDEHLRPSAYGALVGLPNRHLLVCYPIVLSTVMEALQELVPRISEIYDDPPGGGESTRLSSDLYWWRRGEMVSMRAGMNRAGLEGAVVAPPQAFIDAVLEEAARARRKR